MTSFADKEITATDESGVMYVELDKEWEQKGQREYILHLHAHYNYKMQQEYKVKLPNPPAAYRVTWRQGTPPKEYPPQTAGIRIFMVDVNNKPVQGVELGGSPHSLETQAKGIALTEQAIILGPSDEKGYIRWNDVKPGTYELFGSKGGQSQKFTLKMPKNKTMVDIKLVWNPAPEILEDSFRYVV
jgi:hypothetical protein